MVSVDPGFMEWLAPPPSAPLGASIQIHFKVYTTGADAPASVLRVFRSTDAKISRADAAVTTMAVPALGTNGEGEGEVFYPDAEVDVGWIRRTLWFGACVDPVPGETDTTDNCSQGVPVDVGVVPDLAVATVTVSPSPLPPGAPIEIAGTVVNVGSGEAPGWTADIFVGDHPGDPRSFGEELGRLSLGHLEPAATQHIRLAATASDAAGTYWYSVCVEAVEFDPSRTNDCRTVAVAVEGPNLVVDQPEVDDPRPGSDEFFTFGVRVRNEGTAIAPPSFLYVKDTYGQEGETILLNVPVPSLAAGEGTTVSASVHVHGPGLHQVHGCAVAIAGERTTDNCSAAADVEVEGIELAYWSALDPTLRTATPEAVLGHGFSAGTVLMLHVATPAGVVSYGPFQPSPWSESRLDFALPIGIELGNGFASLVAIDRNAGYRTSNPLCFNLVGPAGASPPTLARVAGVALAAPDCAVPHAHVDTVLTPGATFTVHGEHLREPRLNVFTATGNVGPLEPVGPPTSMDAVFALPNATAVGASTLVLVNDPYEGNVSSNAVVVSVGARIAVDAVTQEGDRIVVTGKGFAANTVLNLFNRQGGAAVNLGGLDGTGKPVLGLDVISPERIEVSRPPNAVPGPAFVQALNPPFLASTASQPTEAAAFELR